MSILTTALYRQGASHVKKNVVCQDYAQLLIPNDDVFILALSDGHGSPKYFRSDVGSKFAVETAIEALTEFVKEFEPNKYLPNIINIKQGPIKDGIELNSIECDKIFRHLGSSIIYRWYDKIMSHWDNYPPTEVELQKLSVEDKQYFQTNDLSKRIPKAYGCTLQLAVRAKDYWFAIHIGDGKIVAIKDNGDIYEPVPWDDDCFGTKTTSMCELDSNLIRYCFGRDLSDSAAIFLASDGMDDSFTNFEELASMYGVNIINEIYNKGWSNFSSNLPDLLDLLSKTRSGDDMSLACWIDEDKIKDMLPNILTNDLNRIEKGIHLYNNKKKDVDKELSQYEHRLSDISKQKERFEDAVGELKQCKTRLLERIGEVLSYLKEESIFSAFIKTESHINRALSVKDGEKTRLEVEIKIRKNEMNQLSNLLQNLEREKNTIIENINRIRNN